MKQIYIWGTGSEAEKCITNINFENCIIMGYIETQPKKEFWMDKRVYAYEDISNLSYDYIIIANTHYEEIIDHIRKEKKIEEKKIINWMDVKCPVYYYLDEIWDLFSVDFLTTNPNFYFFSNIQKDDSKDIFYDLDKYEKVYVYDLRLINTELDIGMLFCEIINNLKNQRTGMAFIPNEKYLNENWYHNLLYVLDRNAFVIWKELEGAYLEYVKKYPKKLSFEKLNVLQFVRKQKNVIYKSKYMFYNTELIYKEKRQLIDQAEKIDISLLRGDRIGEQIRVLNQLLYQRETTNVFKIYIPIDGYSKPSQGVNTCFNEIISRHFNLLRNQEEYNYWIQDIFENVEKYQFSGWIKEVNYGNGERLIGNGSTITFEKKELEFGKKLLRDKVKILSDYVCLFTRDSKYLKVCYPEKDYSIHNYRDVSYDVMNMAIDYLGECKIQTVRMGQIAEPCKNYINCIDFVNHGYDEFLDLMLHYYSKFFLGCSAGISMLPMFWNKPTVTLIPYYPCIERNIKSGKDDLCIFNRIYNTKEKRELSFWEIFNCAYDFGTVGGFRGEYFEQHDLELIPFSQEDIFELTKEMNEKLDGVWSEEIYDTDLHNRFEQKIHILMEKNNINEFKLWMPRVATSYLRKYQYLLED